MFRLLPLAFTLVVGVQAAEITEIAASPYQIAGLPNTIPALVCEGSTTRATTLQLKDRGGRWLNSETPGIAQLDGVAWSANDPARDGAGEFEVLLSTARLLRRHALAGFVTVGNSHGALLPNTELALRRVVHMGIPVVRLAREGRVESSRSDLFVAAGALAPADAERILAHCLLKYGALTPAADPARPTVAETNRIRAQLEQYQTTFDLQAAAFFSAQPSESAAALVALR